MVAYSRNPGPWKRYADAAGGDPDAGALLDHILLRFRTDDALRRRWGLLWIIQSMRCWRQEVPLSEKRLGRAIRRLRKADLIVVKIAPLDGSPTRFTHIRLTPRGEEFLNAKARSAKSPDRPKRQRQIDQRDSVDSGESTEPTGCQNPLLITSSEIEDSETSLAPDGARDGADRESEPVFEGRGTDSNECERCVPTKQEIETAWGAYLAVYRPDVIFSGLHGPAWQFAEQIRKVLGARTLPIIEAAIRDWPELRRYVITARGASKCSVVPEIGALATYVDAVQQWLAEQEQDRAEHKRSQREWQEHRERREAEIRAARRDEYERLAADAPRMRQFLADAEPELERALAAGMPHGGPEHYRNSIRRRIEREHADSASTYQRNLQRLVELEAEFGSQSQTDTEDLQQV